MSNETHTSDTPEIIRYTLTNDYMFRAVVQSNNRILKALICSLLGKTDEEVISAEITNPIELGAAIDAKTFILDLKIILNNHEIINIEMQVVNQGNWPERSLGYLCRTFDNLNKGDDYALTKPAIQISILDFTLFDDFPEFYAKYHMSNDKNHHIYTDKFALNVLDLTRIDLATDNDKSAELDIWAKAFKAKTYEDLKLLAEHNSVLTEVSDLVRQLTEEEKIRQQCEARERYEAHERGMKKVVNLLKAEIADKDIELANMDSKIADKDIELANKDAEIANKDIELANKDAEIARLKAIISNKQ